MDVLQDPTPWSGSVEDRTETERSMLTPFQFLQPIDLRMLWKRWITSTCVKSFGLVESRLLPLGLVLKYSFPPVLFVCKGSRYYQSLATRDSSREVEPNSMGVPREVK